MHKSKFKYYAVIWAVLIAIFNVIIFITPSVILGKNKFHGSFWVGYIFITLSFIGNLVITWFLIKDNKIEKTFYNVPLFRVSYISLISMVIIGSICMAVPTIPIWISVLVCLIVLTIEIISMMVAQTAATIVGEIEKQVKVKTLFVKSLTADIETLMSKASSDEIFNEIKKIYEVIRYSDPMSDDALASIETQITLKVSELSKCVTESNLETIQKICDEIEILMIERNKKCKMLK